MKNKVLFLILFLFLGKMYGQIQTHFSFQQGKTLRIHPRYPQTPFAAKGVETGVRFYAKGNPQWHRIFHHPKVGLVFTFWDLGNPQVLGKVYSVLPTLGQTLVGRKKWKWEYDLGFSLAYFTKPYRRVANPTNIAVGSHLSSQLFLRTDFQYILTPSLSFMLGGGFTHCSNGNTTSPNLGVNIPSVMTGVIYTAPTKNKPETEELVLPVWKNEYLYGIRIGGGLTENIAPNGPKYTMLTSNVFWGKDANRWLSWRIGAEVFYSQKAHETLIDGEIIPKGINHHSVGMSVYGGGEITAGHISVLAQAGPYLLNPYMMNYRIYTKFGFQFYPFDRQDRKRKQVFAGVYVHAHSGEADFAELGLGYLF